MPRTRRQRPKGTGTLFKRNGRGNWIARWYDHQGRRMERTAGTTDRAAAERVLRKRIADAALRRDGVIDARADRYSSADRRPILEHASEWEASLVAKRVGTKQVSLLVARLKVILAAVKAERLSDLSASMIQNLQAVIHYKCP